MILQQISIVVSDEAAFEAALIDVRQQVFMTTGFRGFSVAQSAEHPRGYLVQVRWETADDVIAFGQSGRLETAWAPVQPFLDGPLKAEHYVERDGFTFTGPGTADDLSHAVDG